MTHHFSQKFPLRCGANAASLDCFAAHLSNRVSAFSTSTSIVVRGPVEKNELLRTKDSVKILTVPSIEELDTRSMSLFARPYRLLVPVGTHALVTFFSRGSSPSRHFVARARMGLRGGVQARIDTASTTVHHSLDTVARRKSQLLPPAASRVRTLFADLETHVPLDAQRLLGFACRLHGRTHATHVRAPMKTAMEKDQTRERERYTHTIAFRCMLFFAVS